MDKKIIYVSLIFSVFLSCQKDKFSPNETLKDTIKEVHYKSDPDYTLANKNAHELLEHFEKEQHDLHAKLKNANKKEAEALYLDYYKRLTTIVDSLTAIENETLKNFHVLSKTSNDSILQKQKTYDKLGIYFRKIDSNLYDFKLKPGFFFNLFKQKVSKDLEQFIQLRYEENLITYDLQFNDADFDLVKQRELVLRWEQFILKYPNFKFIDYAKKSYTSNLTNYLFGSLDKPSFQITTKRLNIENEQEYITFVKKNPKSLAANVTKEFLKHFYENDKNFTSEAFYINLKEFTKKAIEDKLK